MAKDKKPEQPEQPEQPATQQPTTYLEQAGEEKKQESGR